GSGFQQTREADTSGSRYPPSLSIAVRYRQPDYPPRKECGPLLMDIGEEIRRVLEIEIEGLEAVRSNINENFVRAVELIASSNGHVYVTGTGKSGIIATKIAATMRSTGTPATFLHPSEALHGDIGVVNRNDIVLSIGKSGETSELNELLRIVKKIGATIIAITSNGESSMAALSDIVLQLKIPR